MTKKLHWYDFLSINSYWLGINIASGILTPVLLPALVIIFMPEAQKNTYLATVRVIGLAMAMLVQPLAGMLSDRSTHKMGRRRPYILVGAVLNIIFLFIVGASTLLIGSPADSFFQSNLGVTTSYAVLVLGIVLLQISSNIGHGALQGLIPDIVPENQRGKASGVKAVFELLPVFLVIFIGKFVDDQKFWLVIGIIMAGFLITMLTTLFLVKEKPLEEKPRDKIATPILRIVLLTVIFVGVTQAAQLLVKGSGNLLPADSTALTKILVVGFAGLLAMAGSIIIGVYFGAWVGIGKEARSQSRFIWWVVNRLLFLAAVGSVQGFAQFFLRDVLQIPNAATMTTILLAVVALFLMPSALYGGHLADKMGRTNLVGLAGLLAAGGTILLLFSGNIPMVIISGCIIGLGTGLFFAVNWALGTDLVPSDKAGKYLGISNLAGAGAGIVGAGIGGPMADFFNGIQTGLGYQVIFSIYAALFLFSVVILYTRVAKPGEK